MNRKLTSVMLVILLLFMAMPLFWFRLNEGEQAIITVFGKPRPEALLEPGLRFRLPWWKVHTFEKRILRWDGDALRPLSTSEQTFIYLDTTARWRITNPLKFYSSVKNISGAGPRLDDIISSVVRTKVSGNKLIELVRNSNRAPVKPKVSAFGDTIDEEAEIHWEQVVHGRNEIMDQIIEEAKPILKQAMGIDLIDVRIKRLNYIESVEQSIFDRMITERRRIAQRFRSEGEGEAANILGSMERELKEIRSEAYRLAQEIEGKADAEATAIYADAYNRDPEFYAFVETLSSYRKTMSTKTRMITNTKGDYFKYLKKVKP